jgi:hypothetical protein
MRSASTLVIAAFIIAAVRLARDDISPELLFWYAKGLISLLR